VNPSGSASSNSELPFNWVAGAYYSHLKTNIRYRYLSDQAVTDAVSVGVDVVNA